MDKIFAGLDVSTQSIKVILINLEDKSLVYNDLLNYDEELPDYGTNNGTVGDNLSGVSESDPLMWIDGINIIFQRLKEKTNLIPKIKAISVSGQQHGLVALDKNGKLTKPTSKLWNDHSTQNECDILTKELGGVDNMISEIANTQRTGYTASKIFHMYRNERHLFDNTYKFLLVHNYINWYLTGGTILMESGDASGTALWDPINKIWSKKLTNIISKDLLRKLPEVKASTSSIGFISKVLTDKYGFDVKCKVDAGSGDNMYSAIGTGNTDPGTVTISLGTSGTAFTVLEKPFIDPFGEIACFCDSTENYLPLLCISNMAGGYNTFLNNNKLSHSDFERLLKLTKPGNNGKIIVPWFEGERTPDISDASPLYFGFSLEEINQKSIARAILEGHILNLYQGFKRMPVQPKIIYLTGGLSRSKIWCQMIANIFNCETVPVLGEGAALGAAIHAAWIWEIESGNKIKIKDLSSPFIKVDDKNHCFPETQYEKVYDDLKLLYDSVSNRIRGLKSDDPFLLRKKLNTN